MQQHEQFIRVNFEKWIIWFNQIIMIITCICEVINEFKEYMLSTYPMTFSCYIQPVKHASLLDGM